MSLLDAFRQFQAQWYQYTGRELTEIQLPEKVWLRLYGQILNQKLPEHVITTKDGFDKPVFIFPY